MRAGELRTRIIIQTKAIITDAGGFQSESWTELDTVWAKWVNVHGQEAIMAQSIGVVAAATVTIRYMEGIDLTCCVLKDSDRYEIISMDNYREKDQLIELKVKRMVPG